MTDSKPAKEWIPRLDGRALDAVQLMAAFFIACDTFNRLCFDIANPWIFAVSRAAFPLACYVAAAVVLQAGKEAPRRATMRLGPLLLGYALLMELPAIFLLHQMSPTFVFTLAVGVVFSGLMLRLFIDSQVVMICWAALLAGFLPPPVEFGLSGAALPVLLIVAMRGSTRALLPLAAILATINVEAYIAHVIPLPDTWKQAGHDLAAVLCTLALPFLALRLARRLPQDGKWLPVYSLLVFYPLQLGGFWLLGRYVFHTIEPFVLPG